MITTINQLLDIRSTDADDARRRKLLNILLGGLSLAVLVTVVVTIGLFTLDQYQWSDISLIVQGSLATLVGSILIYLVNRYWSGQIASTIFLIFITAVLAFSDTPSQIANGRSLFVFTIPIVMASVLLSPASSFIFALISSVIISIFAFGSDIAPNSPAIAGYFLLSLISWLSSRSLERALRDLRTINAELDKRVADRTLELSESLSREAAQASQRQAILQGIADGVIVFDNEGTAILANPAIGYLLETPPDQIVDKNIFSIANSPQIVEEDKNTLVRIVEAKEITLAPVRIHWGKRTLSVIAAPVRNVNNQVIGKVAVLRDFTREAEVEEMKNAFVAMVSHELRTPLNAILGYSEMLRDKFYGPVNDRQANAADRILSNSRRLLDIVSDLLDKAQIEAGRLNFQYADFKTVELLDNIHSVMDKLARDKGLELITVIDPSIPDQIHGDVQRLLQVMVNLVNNAVKFTDQGKVVVRIYRVNNIEWAFDVTDTGPGIAPDDQSFIFDPFRQVEGTTTRAHGGIGLGLSIVKRLVNLMGGRILLASEVNHGSTFTVILPFEPPVREE